MIENSNGKAKGNGDVQGEKDISKKSTFYIEDLQFGNFNGVLEVCSFSPTEIIIRIAVGKMTICGSNLEVKSFNTHSGELSFVGEITSISALQAKQSFFSKLAK